MKKCCIVLLLLLSAAFSLHAQSKNTISIFFSTITGISYRPEDNKTLAGMLTTELSERKYTMINTPEGADYLMYGTISLYDENEDYISKIAPNITYTYNDGLLYNNYGQLYILQLVMKKVDTGDIILHNILYLTIEDIYPVFPLLMSNLALHVGGMSTDNRWDDSWLHLGVSVFWTPRVYFGSREGLQSVPFDNFGGGVSAELHFWKHLSLEAGLEIAPDRIGYTNSETYQNIMLEIPFALKYIAKPTQYFKLAPYAGVHFNIPLFRITKSPPVAWMVGVTGGVRVGKGMIFMEPRFSMDIGRSKLYSDTGEDAYILADYQRYIVHVGIGYKHSFFTKK